jgi:hypothetical protein
MPVRALACVALLTVTVAPVTPLWAQRTGDQSRLIFTLWGGFVGGKDLWKASPQVVAFTTPADSLALGRQIRSTLAFGMGGTYFPGEHVGISVEGSLIGLGFEDSCHQVFSSGSPEVAATCESLQGAEKAATAVILSAGPTFRLNSRKAVSPYARLSAGLVFSTQSSLRTIGNFPSADGPVDLIVYADDHQSRVEPSFVVGAGFTGVVGKAYQLRWEIRDNIVGLPRVTGTAPAAGLVPPHEITYKHLLSILVGVDVVLERRRGRRY